MRSLRVALLVVILAQPMRAQDFQRGDCNGDGSKNIADAVRLLNYLFPPAAPNTVDCLDACDANDDGSVNLADCMTILNTLKPVGAPVPWFPPDLCGTDPTPDAVDCMSYPNCP